jgi:hypothetical protein
MSMREWVSICWDIALWKRSPRDLPASAALLAGAAAAYLVTSLVEVQLVFGPALAVERALVDLGLTALVIPACLALRDRAYRALQTLTAILATSCLISVPMILVLVMVHAFGRDTTPGQALAFLLLPLQIWYLFAIGRILRLALDAPLVAGMALALTYALCNDFLMSALPRALGG